MNGLSSDVPVESAEGGPMWGRFFESFAQAQDDNDSVISGSHSHLVDLPPQPFATPRRLGLGGPPVAQSPFSEIHPNDSASVFSGEDVPAPMFGANTISNLGKAAPVPADDGTYVFKFRTPSGRTHRFQARHDDVEILRDIVSGKLSTDPFFTSDAPVDDPSVLRPDPYDFILSYTDNDGDSVLITSNSDVSDAVKVARKAQSDRVVLFIQGGKGWEETEKVAEQNAKAVAAAAASEVKAVEKDEASVVQLSSPILKHIPAPVSPSLAADDQDVFGIPRDLVLPASLGFLGVIIVGVFIATRASRQSW